MSGEQLVNAADLHDAAELVGASESPEDVGLEPGATAEFLNTVDPVWWDGQAIPELTRDNARWWLWGLSLGLVARKDDRPPP